MMSQGWVLLDVRPPGETDKVALLDAVNVPLFVEDPENSFGSLMKKAAAVSTGGWWLGGTHMVPNDQFLAKVGCVCLQRDVDTVSSC
jgi:rhodanese-related sulfurtransferase